jgi:hypothetical protein
VVWTHQGLEVKVLFHGIVKNPLHCPLFFNMSPRKHQETHAPALDGSAPGPSESNISMGKRSSKREVKFSHGPLGTEDGHPLHEGKQDAPPASTSCFSLTRNWGDEVTNLTKRNVGEVINALKVDGDGIYHSSIVRLRRRVDLPSESPVEQVPIKASLSIAKVRRSKQSPAPKPEAIVTPSETAQKGARKRKR